METIKGRKVVLEHERLMRQSAGIHQTTPRCYPSPRSGGVSRLRPVSEAWQKMRPIVWIRTTGRHGRVATLATKTLRLAVGRALAEYAEGKA